MPSSHGDLHSSGSSTAMLRATQARAPVGVRGDEDQGRWDKIKYARQCKMFAGSLMFALGLSSFIFPELFHWTLGGGFVAVGLAYALGDSILLNVDKDQRLEAPMNHIQKIKGLL